MFNNDLRKKIEELEIEKEKLNIKIANLEKGLEHRTTVKTSDKPTTVHSPFFGDFQEYKRVPLEEAVKLICRHLGIKILTKSATPEELYIEPVVSGKNLKGNK